MKHPFDYVLFSNRRAALIVAVILTAAITVVYGVVDGPIPLGFLYLFPILIFAGSLNRWILTAAAAICAVLQVQFSWLHWGEDAAARLFTAFVAYIGAGLFVSEIVRNRHAAVARATEIADQAKRRETAEQQLRALVEGSPAAILTICPEGKVLLANEAAHELLKCEPRSLPGQAIDTFLPTLATFRHPNSIRHLVRTMIECTGYDSHGEAFLAHVWVSSAGPPSTTGLTAVVFDGSEQLRNREEVGLHTLALSARVISGAYWHEARNLCSAMRVVVTSLRKNPAVADSEEVEALSSLMNGLDKLSSAELRPEAEESGDIASLRAVLDHLRIIVEPWFQESEIAVSWQEAKNLPLVRADHHALLQVFLNLARNARRALEDAEVKEFAVSAAVEDHSTVVRFRNTGTPPADPAALFQPFHSSAAEHGLGLHVSRAILRSFGGDLRYEAAPGGSCFTVVLAPRSLSSIYGDAKR